MENENCRPVQSNTWAGVGAVLYLLSDSKGVHAPPLFFPTRVWAVYVCCECCRSQILCNVSQSRKTSSETKFCAADFLSDRIREGMCTLWCWLLIFKVTTLWSVEGAEDAVQSLLCVCGDLTEKTLPWKNNFCGKLVTLDYRPLHIVTLINQAEILCTFKVSVRKLLKVFREKSVSKKIVLKSIRLDRHAPCGHGTPR